MAQLKIINEVLCRAGTREKGRFNVPYAVHEIHVLRIYFLKLMMHRWKRVHARECERTLNRAQREPQTIMTAPRLKCFCNYKFRGAETTTIFATNEFT